MIRKFKYWISNLNLRKKLNGCLVLFLSILVMFLTFLLFLCLQNGHVNEFLDFRRFKKSDLQLITQSSIALPNQIQDAIKLLAQKEINDENTEANLSSNKKKSSKNENQSDGTEISSIPLIQPLIETIQESITTNPSEKAKVELNIVKRILQDTTELLETDTSDKATEQAVKNIAQMSKEMDKVGTTIKKYNDREILKHWVEQDLRVKLLLQKTEDKLPMRTYLKVEKARQDYSIKSTVNLLNDNESLQAIGNIFMKIMEEQAGEDFKELKAIEVSAEVANRVDNAAKNAIEANEREIAHAFENRMLKLPRDVRNRKLEAFVKYSFGNPIRQIQAIENMKDYMTDREMILGLNNLENIVLKKLEDRVFELDDIDLQTQFLESVIQSPEDIKTLSLMKADVELGTDEERKKKLIQMQTNLQNKLSEFFTKENGSALDTYYNENKKDQMDVTDLITINGISQIIKATPNVSDEIKQKAEKIEINIAKALVENVYQRDFVTRYVKGYNPVAKGADVRVLLPNPQTVTVLKSIQDKLPYVDKLKVNQALKSYTTIAQDYVISQADDPKVFTAYQNYINNTPEVKQIFQNYIGWSFFNKMSLKAKVMDKVAKEEEQKLYERVQQITQEIFIKLDNKESTKEKELPESIRKEINELKKQLKEKEVPKLTVPEGVILADVAKLPDDVENAIVLVAKQQLKDQKLSEEVKADLKVEAKDLGVSEPIILPDSPLYSIIETVRDIALAIASNPIQKAQELVKISDEKTLEVERLIERDQTTETIDKALEVLESVTNDYEEIKKQIDKIDITQTSESETKKIDNLMNQIINNGLARQDVISIIEGKVYGENYVKVDAIRQEVLVEGGDILVKLAGGNPQIVSDKFIEAVTSQEGSDLKEIKALELLTEVKRNQPQETTQIIEDTIENLANVLEEKIQQIPIEVREEKITDYVESLPGNPVRKFETIEEIREHADNPETLILIPTLKDIAVEELKERITELKEEQSLEEFVDQTIGNKPEDLKVILDIELRIETPLQEGVDQPSFIQEKIDDIKGIVEENIIETVKDSVETLKETSIFNEEHAQTPDVMDVKLAQELTDILKQTPDVATEVIQAAKEHETQIIDTFIENVSKIETNIDVSTKLKTEETSSQNTNLTIDLNKTPEVSVNALTTQETAVVESVLQPTPKVLDLLLELKKEVSWTQQAKLNDAIEVQVQITQDYLVNEVKDPETFNTYISQIIENPEVAATVAKVGGTEFINAIEDKAQEIAVTAAIEKTKLQTTVDNVSKEIFDTSSSEPSKTELSLSTEIQEKIEEIKHEVPQEQISTPSVSTDTSGDSKENDHKNEENNDDHEEDTKDEEEHKDRPQQEEKQSDSEEEHKEEESKEEDKPSVPDLPSL